MHFLEVHKTLHEIIAERGYTACSLERFHDPRAHLITTGGQRSHIILSTDLARAILVDPSIVPLDITENLNHLAQRLGIDLAPVVSYLRNSPVILSGDRHLKLRKLFLDFLRTARVEHEGFIEQAAERYFESYSDGDCIERPFESIAARFIDPIIQAVAGGQAKGVTADCYQLPTSIFEVIPNPARLSDSARVVGDFLSANGCAMEVDYETLEDLRPYMVLTFFLMGRDPLISTLTSALYALNDGRSLTRTLDAITATALASPVNIVSRHVSADTEIHGLRLQRGDSVFIVLPVINGYQFRHGQVALSMPLGFGTHRCAGKDLSYCIVDSFLGACGRHLGRLTIGPPIDPNPLVFANYSPG